VLSRKSAAVASLAALSLILGTVARSSLLVLASVPLVAFLIISLAVSPGVHCNIQVERRLSTRTVYEDDEVLVTLHLRNRGAQLDCVEAVDTVPEGLSVTSGASNGLFGLAPGETYSFSYTVRATTYGNYLIGPLAVRVGDSQMTRVQDQAFDEVSTLKVLPKIAYVPKLKVRQPRTRNWPGEIVARLPGTGLEFYSIREYYPGDQLKRINWKASARTEDSIFTNQYMSELGGDTIIVVDARTVSEVGVPPNSTVTHSVRAAAIIAYRLLRDRNRVGMIVLGSTLNKVFPGFGRRQFDRILMALADTKPAEVWDIGLLGSFLSMFFSTKLQVVVISPLTDDRATNSIIDVAARGYEVLVVSPSPLEIMTPTRRDEDRLYHLAERLARMNRQNTLDSIRRFAYVVDWNTNSPLGVALSEAVSVWKRARR